MPVRRTRTAGSCSPAHRARPDAVPRRACSRVAMLSVHTSPLDQPGTGDAGGMNVYIVELSRQLAARGVEVEIFTRATSSDLPPVGAARAGRAGPPRDRRSVRGPAQGRSAGPAVRVHRRPDAGRGRARAGLLRRGALALLACPDRSAGWPPSAGPCPLVHTAHTLAKVKNAALADGDAPEPAARVIGEQQVVDASTRLIANTPAEAAQLAQLYDAPPGSIDVVAPGRRPRGLPAR